VRTEEGIEVDQPLDFRLLFTVFECFIAVTIDLAAIFER